MYRTRRRACPACETAMELFQLPSDAATGQVEIDLCRGCGSLFFDFFDGEPASLTRKAADKIIEARPTRQASRVIDGPLTCPDCRQSMERCTYLDLLDGPQIGRCSSCFSVFVPGYELSRMASFYYDDEAVDEARKARRDLDATAPKKAEGPPPGPPAEGDALAEAERFFRNVRIIDFIGSLFGRRSRL